MTVHLFKKLIFGSKIKCLQILMKPNVWDVKLRYLLFIMLSVCNKREFYMHLLL